MVGTAITRGQRSYCWSVSQDHLFVVLVSLIAFQSITAASGWVIESDGSSSNNMVVDGQEFLHFGFLEPTRAPQIVIQRPGQGQRRRPPEQQPQPPRQRQPPPPPPPPPLIVQDEDGSEEEDEKVDYEYNNSGQEIMSVNVNEYANNQNLAAQPQQPQQSQQGYQEEKPSGLIEIRLRLPWKQQSQSQPMQVQVQKQEQKEEEKPQIVYVQESKPKPARPPVKGTGDSWNSQDKPGLLQKLVPVAPIHGKLGGLYAWLRDPIGASYHKKHGHGHQTHITYHNG